MALQYRAVACESMLDPLQLNKCKGSAFCSNRVGHCIAKAVKFGRTNAVVDLLQLGVHPDSHCSKETPLALAVYSGDAIMVELLLKAGANPFYQTDMYLLNKSMVIPNEQIFNSLNHRWAIHLDSHEYSERTALMYASWGGHHRLALLFMSKFGPNYIHRRDDLNGTALTYAACNGRRKFLTEVLPHVMFPSPIMNAVNANCMLTIKQLVDSDASVVNEVDLNGLSPIMLCCFLDRQECLEFLLEKGARVHTIDGSGRNALMFAASLGYTYCVKKLIEYGTLVSWINNNKESALYLAIKNGFPDCVDVIASTISREWGQYFTNTTVDMTPFPNYDFCKENGEVECSLDVCDSSGRTMLMFACMRGNISIVTLLLDGGASVETCSRESGKTALMFAAEHNRGDAMKLLLLRNASINKTDIHGDTALMYCVRNDSKECLEILLRWGAVIPTHGKRFESGLLVRALENYSSSCVPLIVNNMIRTQLFKTDSLDRNYIIYAAKNGDITALQEFIRQGLRLTCADKYGNTPLMYAISGGHWALIKLLVEKYGVLVNECNGTGMNAISVAVFYNFPITMLNYLISYNCEVNVQDINSGATPLILAVFNSSICHVNALLAAGADILLPDINNDIALGYATKKGLFEIVQILLEAERNIPDIEDIRTEAPHRNAFYYACENGNRDMVELFLKEQIFCWTWYPTFCFNLVNRYNLRMLISTLVTSRVPPGAIRGQHTSSPLALAMYYRDFATVKYLISNLYFSTSDVAGISDSFFAGYFCLDGAPHEDEDEEGVFGVDVFFDEFGNQIEEGVDNIQLGDAVNANEDGVQYYVGENDNDEQSVTSFARCISTQPLSLKTLAFLKVSSTIGGACKWADRTAAVDSLCLPETLKVKLKFDEPFARVCPKEWDSIDLSAKVVSYDREVTNVYDKCTIRSLPLTKKPMYRCYRSQCDCREGEGYSFIKPTMARYDA